MSTPAALTTLVIILGVLTLAVVTALVLLAIMVNRFLRFEQMMAADLNQIKDSLKATVGRVQEAAGRMSGTLDRLGAGARYAGWAADAASALLLWRRRAPRPSQQAPSPGRWRRWATGISLGIVAWQALGRRRRPPRGDGDGH